MKPNGHHILDNHADLVKRCLRCDRKAQNELYLLFCDEMYTMVRFIVNDEDWAKDILQKSYIKVFNKLHTLKDPRKLKYWIQRIVTNQAIEEKRGEIYFETINEETHSSVEWPDDMTADYLKTAIHLLDDGFRMVFVMIEMQGYSHKEVAQQLGISVGTSKSQLYHAKRKLKKIINKLLEEKAMVSHEK